MHVSDSFKQEPLCFNLYAYIYMWHHLIMLFLAQTLYFPIQYTAPFHIHSVVTVLLTSDLLLCVWRLFGCTSPTPLPSASSAPVHCIYVLGIALASLRVFQSEFCAMTRGQGKHRKSVQGRIKLPPGLRVKELLVQSGTMSK